MKTVALTLAAALLAAPVIAAPRKASPAPKDSAERFSLDLAPVEEDAAVTASEPPEPVAASPRFTIDTPIEQLIADRRARAVLDRDMPGLSTDKNLDKFKTLTLRRLQPLSDGRLTPELLEKVGRDLAAAE